MKTTIIQLTAATFIAFLLLVGNVKADGTEIKASSGENIETTLQLEKWMTDETFWDTKSVNIAEFARETEAELELENWMTNAEIWNSNYIVDQELESDLVLEGWMINNATWNSKNTEKESKLTVEPWMLDENVWK
jgi:hypothetical protein